MAQITMPTATVEIDKQYFNRLISVAYKTLTTGSLSSIRDAFMDDLYRAQSVKELTEVAQGFVETREFIDMVIADNATISDEQVVAAFEKEGGVA